MAQLKDLIVNGATRLIGDAFVNKIQITAISAPTSAGGTTYGLGTDGYVLKSNGSSVYWGTDSNSVTGVKGNSESNYRTGQVNITASNIGLGNVENTKLSTWTGSTAITTIGTLSTGSIPYSLLTGVPSTVNGHTVESNVPAGAVFTDTWIPLSTSTAGYVAVAPNSTSKFLRGDAKWESVTKSNVGLGSVANLDQSKAIKTITRNGTTFTYACLDGTTGTFTQQDNNTWNAMVGATSSSNGTAGYVGVNPPSTSYNTAFWRADGSWAIPAGTYSLPTASSTTKGGIKVGSGLSIASDEKLSVNWNGAPVQSVAGMTGTVALKTLTLFGKTYNGAAAATITASDIGLSSSMTFLGAINETLTDSATTNVTARGTNTAITKISGGVVLDAIGLEFVWDGSKWIQLGFATDFALNSHVHGNILNNGTLTATATVASGNHLVITNSANQIVTSTATFGTSTGQYLANNGTWQNAVTGVKGNSESSYRTGQVNLTPANIGAAPTLHTHSEYVAKVGDIMTGALQVKGLVGTADIDYGDVLPVTATEGQVFFQLSSAVRQYDIPAGGVEGQILIKNSSLDGDTVWSNAPTLNNYVKKTGDTMTGSLTMDCPSQYPIQLKPWGGTYGTNGTAQIWYCGTNASQSGYYPGFLYMGNSGLLAVKMGDLRASVIRTTDNIYAYKNSDANISVFDTGNNELRCGILMGSGHINHGLYSWNYAPNASSVTASAKWIIYRGSDGEAHSGMKIYGAVWNDYAEYRKSKILEPGRCIKEVGDGELILTTKRLEKGCEIISDTFGFAIGKTEENQCPTAAVGRVLAYPYESIDEFEQNIGQAVCSGPNGTVSIMTDEEVRMWPQCMIGTISEIPSYEYWKAGSHTVEEDDNEELIPVNGRIWIRVR